MPFRVVYGVSVRYCRVGKEVSIGSFLFASFWIFPDNPGRVTVYETDVMVYFDIQMLPYGEFPVQDPVSCFCFTLSVILLYTKV